MSDCKCDDGDAADGVNTGPALKFDTHSNLHVCSNGLELENTLS